MSGAARQRAGQVLARLVPSDWPWALRAGLEPTLLGWAAVVAPTLLVYLTSSAWDAAAVLSLGGAVRVGTALWSLGLGGALSPFTGVGGAQDVLSLPLPGVTLLQGWLVWNVAGRARLAGPVSVLWAALACAGAASLLCLAGGAGRLWWAVLGAPVLTALVVLARTRHDRRRASEALAPLLGAWGPRRPTWVPEALVLAARNAWALLAAALVTSLVFFVTGWGQVLIVHDALVGGSWVGAGAVVLLQLAWLPTVLVWALAWLTGAGFSLGVGTLFSPGAVSTGALPALPVLGALPVSGIGSAAIWVPLVPVGAAALCAWSRRRQLRELSLRDALAASAAATGVLVVGAGAAFWAASGSVGPGRLAHAGPSALGLVLLAVECGTGLCLTTALLHPRTREHLATMVSDQAGREPSQ